MTGTAAPRGSWTQGGAAVLLVAASAFLVFARSLAGGFVWDDRLFVGSPLVRSPGFLLDALAQGRAGDPFGFVRPLRTAELAADFAVGGGAAFAFHLHALLWHAAGSVLFLLVLRRLLGDPRAALAGALFWAVHPVQTEAVAWISCRGDVAGGALTMAAVLLALRSEGFDRRLALSLAAALAALLYKEAAITLFVVIATLRGLKRTRVPVWPYAAVAALFLVWRQSAYEGLFGHVVSFTLGGSFAGTVATMTRAFGFYVAEALLPAQSLDWYLSPSTSFADAAVLGWLAVHATLVAGAFALRSRAPVWTLAVAWFYAFLLPVANWPVFLGIPTAERYLYLSLAGVAMAVGLAVRVAPRRAAPAVVLLLATLAAASVVRTGMWTSDDTLWNAVLADHESPRGRDHFAKELRAEAIAVQRESARLVDDAHRADAASKARGLLERSLENAHLALAAWCAFEETDHEDSRLARDAELTASNVCHRLGRDEEALFHADEAIRIDADADRFGAHDRALALAGLGFPAEAIAAMQRARRLGGSRLDAETASFLARAAAACRDRGLLATAREGFEAAAAASPDEAQRGRLRADAEALSSHAEPDAGERRLLALSAASLARSPRSCPARPVPR